MQREDPGNAPDALCLITTMPDFGAATWHNGAFSLLTALGWSQMMDRMRRRAMVPLVLSQLRPDPKLEKAFGVLPLRDGDTAAVGRRSAGTRTGSPMRGSPTTTGPCSRTRPRSPTSPRPCT